MTDTRKRSQPKLDDGGYYMWRLLGRLSSTGLRVEHGLALLPTFPGRSSSRKTALDSFHVVCLRGDFLVHHIEQEHRQTRERRHEESTTQRRARSHSRHQVRRSSQRTSTRTDRDTTPRPSYASAASTPARRLNTDIAEGNRGRDASARDRGRPHCAHDTVEVLQDKNPSDSRLERALAEHQREAVAERADILFVNHHLHTENENLRDEKHQLAAALNSAEARIRDAEVQHAQTRQLLDARTQELFAMQSVFGPPSALSERDIVRSVEELNEEIFQLSALMADSLVRVAGDQTKVAQAMKTMVQRLGEPVCTALTNDDDAMRLAAVQLTLQATAAFWCGSVVERWALSSSTLERGMRRLYAEISEKEPQAVAARWKAVARKNMQDAEDATDGGMRERLCEMLQDVLDAAGYAIEDEHGERGVALGEGVATVLRLSVGLGAASGTTARRWKLKTPPVGQTTLRSSHAASRWAWSESRTYPKSTPS